jgi:hypothetical protein
MLIKSETWDEVTAPAIPSGWNVTAAGGFTTIITATAGPTPISAPNMLYQAAGPVSARTITWATLDGNSGNVQVQGTGLFDTSYANSEFAVFARCNTSSFNPTTDTAYVWKLSGSAGAFEVLKYVAGTITTLFSISVSSLSAGVFYRITGQLFGTSSTTIQASVTRLSDGFSLSFSSGTFTAGSGLLSFIDASSPNTGQGYAGWLAYPAGPVPVWGDDWSLSTFSITALAATENRDIFAGVSNNDYAALAGSEAHDTFAGSARATPGSRLSAIERHDTASIYARVSPFLQGTEHHDLFAASATARPGLAAALTATETHDLFSATGGFTYDARSSWSAFERGDIFATAHTGPSSAVMGTIASGDTFAAAVSFAAHASAAITETGDTFRGGLERVAYHVYANTGAGDPINYSSAIDTTSGLTFTTSPLSYPGTWEFGVRAYHVISGLEEQNLDCSVAIVLDAAGNDISNKPMPPIGLRAFAMAAGVVRTEWSYGQASGPTAPQGFHVYIGTGSTPSYSTPVATVSFNAALFGQFVANLTGLSGGTTYAIGVRAFNATAEEANTSTVTVTADATGPSAVEALTGAAT